jgi:hypothetical protein
MMAKSKKKGKTMLMKRALSKIIDVIQLVRWFVVIEDQQVFAKVKGVKMVVLMNKECLRHKDF